MSNPRPKLILCSFPRMFVSKQISQEESPTQSGQSKSATTSSIQQRALNIRDNLDLLELALERSIEWSLGNRSLQEPTGSDASPNESDAADHIDPSSSSCRGLDSLEQSRDSESHARAFVTRFKIELNQLMSDARSLSSSAEQQFSFSENDDRDEDDDEDEEDSFSDSMALTEGVYKIQEDTQLTTDDEQQRPVAPAASRDRQMLLGIIGETRNAPPPTHDDGYRSLSRDSTTTTATITTNGQHARVKSLSRGVKDDASKGSGAGQTVTGTERQNMNLLIQQLNDIKSRVIDLVHELDQIVERPQLVLDEDELEAYRRRRDALVLRVDQLIGGQQVPLNKLVLEAASPPALSGSLSQGPANKPTRGGDPAKAVTKTMSSNINQSTTGMRRRDYEEQVHVIDYDFNRRARDLSEIRRNSTQSERQLGTIRPLLQPLVIEKGPGSGTKVTDLVVPPKSTTMIELNAMMTDYEKQRSRRHEQATVGQGASLGAIPNRLSLSSRTSSSASSSSFI